MKKLFLFLFAFLFLFNFVSAANSTCVYFFYGDGCPHCAKVEPVINELEVQSAFPVDVHRFEVYSNRSNIVLLNELFEKYNVDANSRGVPVAFVGNEILIGDQQISENIYNVIKNNSGASCPLSENQKTDMDSVSIIAVISAALVDSINPCAIAVLLILLTTLLATGNKRRAMHAGIAFTISIYIAYFLFGLGLFSALQISGLSYWFYKVIGFLAVIIGLANIKDFFWYGAGGFVMEIPRKWRPNLKKMLSEVTSPLGAFVLGFVVCLFELPCTGGPYIVILGLLAEKMTLVSSIPLLLLYNVFFVLPLLVLTLAIYFGFSNVESTAKWKDKNIRILHLIAGIVMLTLGILISSGII